MKTRNTTKSVLCLAGAAIACSATLHGAVIYEGFEVGDGTLAGNAGGFGFSGNSWSGQSLTTAGSLSYGSLQTSGGRAITNPGNQFDTPSISPGTTLTSAGLMANGATLWFSTLIVNHARLAASGNDSDNRTYVSFGTGGSDGFDRVGGNTGSGFTIAVSKVSYLGITAQAWNDGSDGAGGATRGATVTGTANSTFLAVGSITWGEFGVANDVFKLYLPGTDLTQPLLEISKIEADFDQLGTSAAANAFDTIGFSGGRPQNGVPEVDEIRFGASYAEVTPVPEPSAMGLLGLGGFALMLRRRK